MSNNPLTHHEILTLAEPFSRGGRQVDLAATDRPERCLVFKARELAAAPPLGEPLREELVLENPRPDLYRLTRTLTTPAGLTATLRVEGQGPQGLVEGLERIDPQGQFELRHGVLVARSYRLAAGAHAGAQAPAEAPPPAPPVLAQAVADLGGVVMTFDAMTGPGWPVEIRLVPAAGRAFDPPEDLLAVLGWSWRSIKRFTQGWRADLRVAKREPARTPDCERKLVLTLDHLVRVLGAPPARFHARFRRARWVFVGRRVAGMLAVLGALAAGPLILWVDPKSDSVLRMLAFNSPNFLLFAWFLMRDIPSVRPPRIPASLPATAWEPLAPPRPKPIPPSDAAPAGAAPSARRRRAVRWLVGVLRPGKKEYSSANERQR